MFIVILLFVLCVIFFDGQPQRAQLLPSGAVLNLAGDGIEPLLQFPIADELSASSFAMDEYYICPAFDAQNFVFGTFQVLRDRIYSNAEFLGRLDAAK